MIERLLSHVSLHSLPNAGQRYELNRKQTSKNALLTYEEEFFLSAGLHRGNGITGSVLLITFEVSVLHIVLDSLCTSICSIVFKCEGKDTNLFSIIQIFNAEK